MIRRSFLGMGGVGLLSGFLSTVSADGDPRGSTREGEEHVYTDYVETSPDFELLQSAVQIDWILVDQVALPRRAVRLELLRLDYPERKRAVVLPLDPGIAVPMVSVIGPAHYDASVSFGADQRGPTTQFIFEHLVGVKIYRARNTFREVVIVADNCEDDSGP